MSEGHHIVPKSTLLKVFGGLIALTAFTYVSAQFDLGPLNIPLAIAIASTKSALVVMFFMALKYDNPVNTLTFSVGVIFVVIFITFTLFDTAFRGDIGNVSKKTVQEIQREEEQLKQREEAISPEQLRVTPADYGNATSGSGSSDSGASSSGSSDGASSGSATDSGSTDSGSTDSGSTDSGSTDSGSTDSGS